MNYIDIDKLESPVYSYLGIAQFLKIFHLKSSKTPDNYYIDSIC